MEQKELSGEDYEFAKQARRQLAQRRMAWTALWSMIVYSAALFTLEFTPERAELIKSTSDLFYVAMASIVGAFVGVSVWMSRR